MPKPKYYTTAEVSQLTGIPEGTIRSWMSRHPGRFVENQHYVIEETGRKMWTDSGLEFLKTTTPESEPKAPGVEAVEIAIEPLLNAAADHYAQRFWQELPVRVLQKIQRMRTQPTPEEKTFMEESVKQTLSIGTFELLPTYIKRLPDAETENR